MSGSGVPFTKMHGAGNDYVYVDAVADPKRIEALCDIVPALAHRHTGIGADGLIAITRDDLGSAEVRMSMWNADGSRGALCVNGLRCAAWFARQQGVVTAERFDVATDVGVHPIELLDPPGPGGDVRVQVAGVRVDSRPTEFEVGGALRPFYVGDAGNPHAVVFVDDDPDEVDLATLGLRLQTHPLFPRGVNVEVVRVENQATLVQRTFERGSGETMACGSGAVVAACAALDLGHCTGTAIDVRLRGGTLRVERKEKGQFSLRGPVMSVFEGTWPTRGGAAG